MHRVWFAYFGFFAALLLALGANAQNIIRTVAGGGPNNVSAVTAGLDTPPSVAAGSAGNFFVAAGTRVFKVNSSGTLTVFAGNDSDAFGGDGGPAVLAELSFPQGVAIDRTGNIFIADTFNNVIRRIDAFSGNISTVAGVPGVAGFNGDGCPATSFDLNSPSGVAVDAAGNVFIADSGNNRVREVVAANSCIITVAGTGVAGFNGDGVPAPSAELNFPQGVAVDASGNVFIADTGNNRIREVSAGVISTAAGNGTAGFSGDGGPAASAELNFPVGVALDSSANILIADSANNRVRVVTAANGKIVTIAGNGTAGFSGDGGVSGAAELDFPSGVALDSSGNLLIADSLNNAVRHVDFSTGIITTVAGNRTPGFSGDGGPAGSAELDFPEGTLLDSAGNVFVADTFNNVIRKVDTTGTISTVAGNAFAGAGFSGDGGAATSAQLNTPSAVTLDSSGNLFIADSLNNRIRRVDHATGTITTVAGNGTAGFSGDGGAATSAQMNFPGGVVVDASGNIFIADLLNNRVRRVDASTGVITTVAGTGTAGFSGDGGPAASAQLNLPEAVALGGSGNLFIADTNNSRIRKVSSGTGIITTVAGNGVAGFSGDGGAATSAELNFPEGVGVDSFDNLFIADTGNNRIRRVIASTGKITTTSGTGIDGFSGDGGVPTSAMMNFPEAVALDSADVARLMADTFSSRIRREVNIPQMRLAPSRFPFPAEPIGTTSAAQAATVSSVLTTGAILVVNGASTTGDFAIQSNTCTTSLVQPQTCTINVNFTPTDFGPRSGQLTVTSNASNSPQFATLSGSGPDFTVSANPSSFTVVRGNSATSTISVSPVAGFNKTAALTCSGAPRNSTCTISPSSVTPNGVNPATATLTFTTTAATPTGTFTLTVTGTFTSPLSGAVLTRTARITPVTVQ